MTSNEAWDTIQAAFARIDAAPGPQKRRRRRAVAAEVGDAFAQEPDLVFSFDERPPKHTLQAGRGVQVVGGRPRFFTRKAVKLEAARLEGLFRSVLPEGWEPRGGAVKLEVLLVYPARREDRMEGSATALHTERPDADNLTKSIMDSMTRAGVWADDAQVCDLTIRKRRSAIPRWTARVWFARSAQALLPFST